jgi:hypothetical protein
MLARLWRSFWQWFAEPVPFPRDHWYRQEVIVLWDMYFEEDAAPQHSIREEGQRKKASDLVPG